MDTIEYQCTTDTVKLLPKSFRAIQDIYIMFPGDIDLEETVKISIAVREVTPLVVPYWPIQKMSDNIIAILVPAAAALAPSEPPVRIQFNA